LLSYRFSFPTTVIFVGKGGDPEPIDEEFGFGGYMPSTMTSSRPSSKRSVRLVVFRYYNTSFSLSFSNCPYLLSIIFCSSLCLFLFQLHVVIFSLK